jgi:hypothetical protein
MEVPESGMVSKWFSLRRTSQKSSSTIPLRSMAVLLNSPYHSRSTGQKSGVGKMRLSQADLGLVFSVSAEYVDWTSRISSLAASIKCMSRERR